MKIRRIKISGEKLAFPSIVYTKPDYLSSTYHHRIEYTQLRELAKNTARYSAMKCVQIFKTPIEKKRKTPKQNSNFRTMSINTSVTPYGLSLITVFFFVLHYQKLERCLLLEKTENNKMLFETVLNDQNNTTGRGGTKKLAHEQKRHQAQRRKARLFSLATSYKD